MAKWTCHHGVGSDVVCAECEAINNHSKCHHGIGVDVACEQCDAAVLHDGWRAEVAALRAELASVRAEYAQHAAEVDAVSLAEQAEHERLTAERDAARADAASLAQQVRDANEALNEAAREVADRDWQISEIVKQHDDDQAEIARLAADLAAMTTARDNALTYYGNECAETRRLRHRVEAYERGMIKEVYDIVHGAPHDKGTMDSG
jgi:predicted  nucleic acid-binding Zn-ribbon protein